MKITAEWLEDQANEVEIRRGDPLAALLRKLAKVAREPDGYLERGMLASPTSAWCDSRPIAYLDTLLEVDDD